MTRQLHPGGIRRVARTAADTAGREWMDDALCAEIGGDAFFPEKGEPVGPAKSICASCGVREECLTYALSNSIDWGIWGGFSVQERRRMRAKRKASAA